MSSDQRSYSSSQPPGTPGHARNPSVQSLASGSAYSGNPRLASVASSQKLPNGTANGTSGRGMTIVLYDERVFPGLLATIEALILQHSLQEIQILTRDRVETKQLKMDCYAIAGKLRRDLAVHVMREVDDPYENEPLEVLESELPDSRLTSPYGFLLCASNTSSRDNSILEGFASTWRHLDEVSTGLVFSVARYALPLLHQAHATFTPQQSQYPQTNGHPPHHATKPFFLVYAETDKPRLDSVHQIAQDALLRKLSESPNAEGVSVGYTCDHVAPLPAPKTTPPRRINVPRAIVGRNNDDDDDGEGMQGSPTKEWNLWAMQEQT